MAKAHPAIFTADGSGYGSAAALNQNGSVNSASNPAAQGSIVSLFMTGLGAMDPRPENGSIPVAPTSKPLAAITASIGGSPLAAELTYVGDAPGLVAGAVQLNVKIPQLFETGQATIRVAVGNTVIDNLPFVTVWVK